MVFLIGDRADLCDETRSHPVNVRKTAAGKKNPLPPVDIGDFYKKDTDNP
jgi:hypothetical protein